MGYGASPMPLDLLKRATARLGPIFQQGYGMTEAAPLLTWLPKASHSFEEAGEKWAAVKSAGRPIVGVDVRVVDTEDRQLPPYEIGEVIARGDNVMMGYWKREEITANTLRNGWLHTGDLGAFDERGYLHILDRAKDMIKTGGENVYSPEVETVLYRHPSVLEAAIIGIPDEKWGEAIRAVVVLRPGCEATGEEIITFCREHLTHFKCPSSVEFIDALPKGGTGKIQKNRLREKFWQGQEKRVN
jgi:long-chain acyl-CoA synthetase